MAGVVLENVSRVYPGSVSAVKRVTLTVEDREFLVLVGPSGCGKTTTLRMIAGLEDVSDGKIAIGTRTINDVRPKDRDIAMVFQNYALYPHLTVYQNLAFGLELRERRNGLEWLWQWALPATRKSELAKCRSTIDERVCQAAQVLGIEELLQRYPRQLSGGERQRVALGRAIVRQPAVFLFDEPLSNLDAKLREEMRRELKQLHQRIRTTIVYVTHDQVEALTLGDRIAVMNEGTIQQVGYPSEVYDWPSNRFVAGFIGAPAMNFIVGELIESTEGFEFRRAGWTLPLKGRPIDLPADRNAASAIAGQSLRPVVLGIRPEDVKIEKQSDDRLNQPGAVVRWVEMLGDATVLTIEIKPGYGEHKNDAFDVQTKAARRTDLRRGDRVSVQVDVSHVHLFDPATGENWVRQQGAR
jgi:multiple sugar transport system ATP-binding protein